MGWWALAARVTSSPPTVLRALAARAMPDSVVVACWTVGGRGKSNRGGIGIEVVGGDSGNGDGGKGLVVAGGDAGGNGHIASAWNDRPRRHGLQRSRTRGRLENSMATLRSSTATSWSLVTFGSRATCRKAAARSRSTTRSTPRTSTSLTHSLNLRI